MAATARHLAQEVEAARAGADEAARLALMRATENRRLIKQLARVREVRGTRLAAQQQARHLAQEAAAEQVRLAEEARRVETESQVGVVTKALSGQTEAQPPAVVASTDPPGERAASEPFAGRAGFRGEPDWRVTVLMIMTPGTYGIRRGASIADPVLCTTDGCYVSIGSDRAAIFMPTTQGPRRRQHARRTRRCVPAITRLRISRRGARVSRRTPARRSAYPEA